MKNLRFLTQSRAIAAAASAVAMLAPGAALACACGCGVFDVGDNTLLPMNSDTGLTLWLDYNYMDQNKNWEGSHQGPATDNGDKQINTSFYTVGGEYMVNRSWTVIANLPIYSRTLTTTDDGTVFGPAGSVYAAHDTAQGDLEVDALYTGFSPDMSSGLSLGVMLPTGDWKGPIGPLGGEEYDRDSLPGTGNTQLVVGGYHVGKIGGSSKWSYFVQTRYQVSLGPRDGYRPGNESDTAVGVTYDLGEAGVLGRVSPTLQLLDSYRLHDTGPQADPLNSGYERLLISPGVSFQLTHKLNLYADVEIPLYQHTNTASSVAVEGTSGQLVAPALFKMQLSYAF